VVHKNTNFCRFLCQISINVSQNCTNGSYRLSWPCHKLFEIKSIYFENKLNRNARTAPLFSMAECLKVTARNENGSRTVSIDKMSQCMLKLFQQQQKHATSAWLQCQLVADQNVPSPMLLTPMQVFNNDVVKRWKRHDLQRMFNKYEDD